MNIVHRFILLSDIELVLLNKNCCVNQDIADSKEVDLVEKRSYIS